MYFLYFIDLKYHFQNQRRIEKTEIIEIAIKYIRNFVSSNEKSCKIVEAINLNRKSNLKIDAYHSGYHNGIYDLFEYTQKNLNNDKFLSDLVDYIDEQEVQLEDLTGQNKDKGIYIYEIIFC